MLRRDIWSFNSRRLIVPTVEVLNTNVRLESKLPDGFSVKSDFMELWEILDLTVDDIRKYSLFAHNEKGERFSLRPVQLMAVIITSRGSVPSSFKMEISEDTLQAEGCALDEAPLCVEFVSRGLSLAQDRREGLF